MLATMRTSPGNVRENNEDACLVHPCGLYIVADGMGGHRAGEIASGIAVETLAQVLPCAAPTPLAMREAIDLANSSIYSDALSTFEHFGMGTTLTALWADEGSMLIAQVGDSRAYLLRDGMLHLCTRDHSVVDELLRKKLITPEQARVHPHRSVITRALGIAESVQCDVFEWDRMPGDIWLLCSDGLSDMLDDARIGACLKALDIDNAADCLLNGALDAGGPDNITLIILLDDGAETAQ